MKTDPLQISPYTSTVPLVQLPVQDTYPGQPQQNPNVWGGKGTSALAIGDALLKGFMQGHQVKEQRKNAEAQATIAAADAGTQAAYEKYQDALTQANGDVNNDQAKAAYQAYLTAFNQGKETKAKFVIPEKPTKSQSGQQKKGEKGEKKTGWSNFKDFFEANPHIVPQIALMTMQPKAPGLSAEGQQQVQNLESQRLANSEAQRKAQNEKTYQDGYATFAPLSQDEVAKLPPDVKSRYDQWLGAKAALTPIRSSGTMYTYKRPDGTLQKMYPEEAAEIGAELYVPSQEIKPGSDAELEQKYLTSIGKTFETASAEDVANAVQYVKTAKTSGNTTTSTSSTDVRGNRTTTTTRTPTPGKIGPPPQASKQSGTGAPQNAPTGSTQFTVGAKPQGMVEEGNLPIWNRPTVQNADGSHSSEYSTSFQDDKGREVLVPTVVNGKFLTPDGKKPKEGSPEEKAMFKAAWQHYLQTGENLGKFDNADDADKYAQTLHNRSESKPASKGGISRPPQGSKTAQGGISAPPTATPRRKQGETDTQYTARVTAQATEKQAQGYQKAEATYRKSLEAADKNFEIAMKRAGDDTNLQQLATQAHDLAKNMAQQQLEIDKKAVATAYDAAVRQIGGTPGDQKSRQNSQKNIRWYQGHPYAQDPQTGQWQLQTGQ